MIGVTPIGVYTEDPEASQRFYRNVLGIEQVTLQTTVDVGIDSEIARAALVRLESPAIDVGITETRVRGSRRAPFSLTSMNLSYRPRDFNATLLRLVGNHGFRVPPSVRGRGVAFADLNGITWEVHPPGNH